MSRWSHVAFAVAVLVAFLVLALPTPGSVAPGGLPAPSRTVAGGSPASLLASPLVPHPAVGCPNTNPPTPAYTTVGGLAPPSPTLLYQIPCNLVSEDEVHATFSSTQAYSGERFTVPLWLPPDGSSSQSSATYEVLLGVVVAGDANSAWGQSYAELTFTPGSNAWSEDVAVWSMQNDSLYGGTTAESMWACPANSMALSWNESFFCVVQMISTTSLGVSVAGNSFVNVTFVGKVGGSGGLTVYSNDSTNSVDSTSYTFSSTNTGSKTFEPFYNASCPDACFLKWAFPYGNGFGAFPVSYSETTIRGMPPLTIGVPRYWSPSSATYAGEFPLFATESTSGVCNQLAPPATVASCANFLINGGTGYYPFFSFNGSQMNYGSDWPWTSIRLGGPTGQFLANGAANDLTPLWFYSRSNSSLAGFSPPASTIYLNATAEALGSVSGVTYAYALNGGSWTGGSLVKQSGSTTNATFSIALPSSLGNGELNYTLNATDLAGSYLKDPPFTTYHIRRGPLPTFTVNLTTNGGSCARIEIAGLNYTSGSQFVTHPGYFPLRAIGCYPWNFTQWVPTGGTAITPNLAVRNGMLEVYGNGSVNAVWAYIRPLDTIAIATSPTICGLIGLDGNNYSNGATVQLLDGLSHVLGNTTCGGYFFAGYTFVGNFTILGDSFVPNGNGTLTANFVLSSSAVAIQFFTEPSNCGGVLYRGAGYTNRESLSVLPGTYAIAGGPCAHFGFLEWQLSGGLSVSGNNLTVTGAGSITEVNYHLTEVTFHINPSACGTVLFDTTTFSDGQVVSVQNNSTHTVYPVNASDCYLIAMSATGGITLQGNYAIINGSGEVDVSFAVGIPSDTIAFLTSPADCGSIWFNNQPYYNANFTSVAPGLVVTITAKSCAGYGFVRWLTFGPISIVGTTAWLNSSGAIEAVFEPLAELFLNTVPASCGSIVLDGQSYTNNVTILVPQLATYSLLAVPCSGFTLSHWENTSSLLLTPGSIYVAGGGVLTAVFVPIVYSILVTLNPPSCGDLLVNGARTTNGTVLHLAEGNYPLTPQPCLGDHLDHWEIVGNLSVSGATLTVGGAGNLTAVFLPVPPSVTLSVFSSTLVGQELELYATVAVPVPPFNYTYTWSFGDGTPSVTTPANFTSHTFRSTGSFTVSVSVHDPFGRVANASAPISVLPVGGTQAVTLSSLQIAAFGVIGAALLLVFAVAYLRGRSTRAREAPEGAPGPAPDSPSPETERNHDK